MVAAFTWMVVTLKNKVPWFHCLSKKNIILGIFQYLFKILDQKSLNNFAYTKKTNISLASKSGLHEKS
jgi:hypothetical protein